MQIIFITGYSDYIAEGCEVAALHYLMKPVNEEKLRSVLDRAAEKLFANEKILNFECGGEMARVPIYQIRYADVFGNYVTVHAKADVTVKMTLGEPETRLDERFFRAGRSVIVNLTRISRVTKTEIRLDDGTAIPLPRGAYDRINRAIIDLKQIKADGQSFCPCGSRRTVPGAPVRAGAVLHRIKCFTFCFRNPRRAAFSISLRAGQKARRCGRRRPLPRPPRKGSPSPLRQRSN